MFKRKVFIPMLVLMVGLVGVTGALAQGVSGQRVEPPVGTPRPDLPSVSDVATAQTVESD